METVQKDLRFDEFLRLCAGIPEHAFRLSMCSVREEWTKEITEKFSISALRYVFREAKPWVRKFTALCLCVGATNARDAERALPLWRHYSQDERAKLVALIVLRAESDELHRAAYVLTRCGWSRGGSALRHSERSTLIAFLKASNSLEHARSALRWDAEAGNPLDENERQMLRTIGRSKKTKHKVGPY